MRWLITGGCGFIGTSLISRLTAAGNHTVRVVDDLSVGTRDDLAGVCDFMERDCPDAGGDEEPSRGSAVAKVELIVADVLNDRVAVACAAGVDVIVHLAAKTGVGPSVLDPRTDCITNVIGTLNYLEAARHACVPRFIFASSGAPVGDCTPPIHEELPAHPSSPYGASKLAGEAYCSAYFRTYGLATVALRFGNVYGPGSGHKHSVVAKFIRQAMAGESLEIYGDGSQTRDFVFIEDLTSAICAAATVSGIGGEIFQIATNRETTLSELSSALKSVLVSLGYPDIQVNRIAPRMGDVRRNFSDTSKARRLLDWEARTGLEQGLQRTVLWFAQRKRSKPADVAEEQIPRS